MIARGIALFSVSLILAISSAQAGDVSAGDGLEVPLPGVVEGPVAASDRLGDEHTRPRNGPVQTGILHHAFLDVLVIIDAL